MRSVLTWPQLLSLGVTSGQSFSVSVTISDGNGLVLTSAPVTVTVNQATPTVAVTDVGGAYNDLPYAATATVAGVIPGVDNTPAASLPKASPQP